jgi:hypothetical protein
MDDNEATRRPLSLMEDEGTGTVQAQLDHSGVSDEDVDMVDEGSFEYGSQGGSWLYFSTN